MMKVQCELHRGIAALWEKGGARGNRGSAVVIAAPDGSPLRPVDLEWHANYRHGLFTVGPEYIVVRAVWSDKTGARAKVYRIRRFHFTLSDWPWAVLEKIGEAREESIEELGRYAEAAKAAIEKAKHRNCRELHYSQWWL